MTKLSIIIPAYKEADMLHDLLSEIDIGPNVQVIVVDKPTGDGTKMVADEFDVVYLTCDGDVSASRNMGAERASGDWLLFLDSDVSLSHWSKTPMKDLLTWLETNSHVRVATGPMYQATGTSDIGSEIRELYRKAVPTLSGGYALFTREMFWKLGGFRPRTECFLWWEDADLSVRASLLDVIHTLPFAVVHRRGFQFRLPDGALLVSKSS